MHYISPLKIVLNPSFKYRREMKKLQLHDADDFVHFRECTGKLDKQHFGVYTAGLNARLSVPAPNLSDIRLHKVLLLQLFTEQKRLVLCLLCCVEAHVKLYQLLSIAIQISHDLETRYNTTRSCSVYGRFDFHHVI